MRTTLSVLSGLSVLLLTGVVLGQAKHVKDAIYDTKTDAKKDIAAAVAKAKHDNKRVLLMFGSNSCGWCTRMDAVFKKESTVRRALLYEYVLVHVDIGSAHKMNKNIDLGTKYGSEFKHAGVPYLTILDAAGKTVGHSGTRPLRDGPKVDPKKVTAFLAKHKAKPLDATDVLSTAQGKAFKHDRKLLIHLSAPS